MQPATLGLLVREIWAGNIHHAFTGPPGDRRRQGDHAKLTPRELEILQLVAGGASNGVIARQLWVTEQTVKFHLSNVYRKLGVSNRTEAEPLRARPRAGRSRPPAAPRPTRSRSQRDLRDIEPQWKADPA